MSGGNASALGLAQPKKVPRLSHFRSRTTTNPLFGHLNTLAVAELEARHSAEMATKVAAVKSMDAYGEDELGYTGNLAAANALANEADATIESILAALSAATQSDEIEITMTTEAGDGDCFYTTDRLPLDDAVAVPRFSVAGQGAQQHHVANKGTSRYGELSRPTLPPARGAPHDHDHLCTLVIKAKGAKLDWRCSDVATCTVARGRAAAPRIVGTAADGNGTDVTMTCVTEGADIYYAVYVDEGSGPTGGEVRLHTHGSTVRVDAPPSAVVVRAIAACSDMCSSSLGEFKDSHQAPLPEVAFDTTPELATNLNTTSDEVHIALGADSLRGGSDAASWMFGAEQGSPHQHKPWASPVRATRLDGAATPGKDASPAAFSPTISLAPGTPTFMTPEFYRAPMSPELYAGYTTLPPPKMTTSPV